MKISPEGAGEEDGWKPFVLNEGRTIRAFGTTSFLKSVQYIMKVALSMLSGHWFSKNVADVFLNKPEEIYSRLISEWGTIGVISSLLLSLSFSSFFLFQGSTDLGIITFCCCACFTLSIVISVIFAMSLSTLPKEYSARFILEFQWLITAPEFFMLSGLYGFILQATWAGYAFYGETFMKVCFPIIGICVFIGFYVWIFIVIVLDREGGLWETAKLQVRKD